MHLWCQETWPEVKKRACRKRRTLVVTDESRFYLLPEVVRTYAPRGRRPIQREWQTHDHVSVMRAMTPKGRIVADPIKRDPLGSKWVPLGEFNTPHLDFLI